ncbi:DUF5681 domain-containing protein [Bradyrhizobium pachyrhizi]|uniref:DUF5681 domain-containing protein n=1 Tax=Bradyrhizobium pachyrhizi TaxID=280333 RepID=UPI00067E308E|nr:DUF5681 domain-containing protein [Bradyrhizobium pachyrhizi]
MAFEKGKSGNPGGRKKEKPFADALRVELAAVSDQDSRGLRAIARKVIKRAEAGDLAAASFIADRLDGKPAVAIENGEDGPFETVSRIELVAAAFPDGGVSE